MEEFAVLKGSGFGNGIFLRTTSINFLLSAYRLSTPMGKDFASTLIWACIVLGLRAF